MEKFMISKAGLRWPGSGQARAPRLWREVIHQRAEFNRGSNAYHYGGKEALKAKPIPGTPMKLDGKQTAKLARIICKKTPLQLKFEFALLTLTIT